MMTVVQTNGLSHDYGSFRALDSLTIDVQRGEIFGFLGPNGAGKTTAIRTLLDFIRPSAGTAAIFGMDSRRDSVAIRKRIGYLPSELTLWENWSGVQYIEWLEAVRDASFLDEARRLASKLEFDLDRPLRGMSTGMKRKIGLIAALAHKPALLILDEPSTGLDPLMQKVFNDLMREARSEGRTVFLSSHNLAEVEAICDRVGIIRDGKLQAIESVTTLTRVTFRWLTFSMSEPPEVDGFAAIEGVTDVEVDGSQVRMRVSGEADVDRIIKLAATHTIRDFNLEHPSLEEVFLAYYGGTEE